MTLRSQILRLFEQEDLNFLLTNRIPRRLATQFMGWFSKIEQPLVRDLSIGLWRFFSDLDLSEAKKTQLSQHARLLHPGAQGRCAPDRSAGPKFSSARAMPSSAHPARSPAPTSFRSRASPTRWRTCCCDRELVDAHRDGRYVTLRLTSSMYHRFHAPHDCRVEQVTYISGDTWNVNPIALRRVEKLFCKNERAMLRTTLTATAARPSPWSPVAAILVASIRLNFLDGPLGLRHRGPDVLPCDAAFGKGQEMGWFEHGSTIIVFAPDDFSLCENVREGDAHSCRAAADAGAVMARSASLELSFRFRHVRTFVRAVASPVPPPCASQVRSTTVIISLQHEIGDERS